MEALMAKVSTEAEAFSKISDITKARILSEARNLAVGESPATAGYDDRDACHGDEPKDGLARFILEGVPGTMYFVPCTVCCVLCILYRVLCTVCYVLCACGVLCACSIVFSGSGKSTLIRSLVIASQAAGYRSFGHLEKIITGTIYNVISIYFYNGFVRLERLEWRLITSRS